MKIVIGVDWSDEAFAAVQQILLLYRPTEVALVHGIEMGVFEYPALAQVASIQGYEEFRLALTKAGQQVLDRTAQMIPAGPDVKKVNAFGNPAQLVINAAQTMNADLITTGARGRGAIAETIFGSVSQRVVMHAGRPTLVVKGSAKPVQRALVAVEEKKDAEHIVRWLLHHPFANPVELCVLNVVAPLKPALLGAFAGLDSWSAAATAEAEEFVKTVATSLSSPHYTVTAKIMTGEPAATVAEQAKDMDLVVVASHGRQGLDRFLLGSVSHSILHRVQGSVLVVR